MLRSVHCGHPFKRGWRQIWCSLWFNFLKTTTHARLSVGNINNTVIRDMQIHTDVEEGNWEAKEVPSLYSSLEVGFFIDPVSDSWSDGASSFFFPLLTHGRAKTITACVARCSRPFRVISPRLFQLSARLYQGGGRYTLYTKYRIDIKSSCRSDCCGNVHVTSKATVHSTGVISSPTATPHNGQGKEESAKLLAWNNAV